MSTMISFRALSDLCLLLSSLADLNDALVDDCIFLECLDIFSSDILVLFQLPQQIFVLSLYLLQHLGFFYSNVRMICVTIPCCVSLC